MAPQNQNKPEEEEMDPRMNRIMLGVICIGLAIIKPFGEAMQMQKALKKENSSSDASIMGLYKAIWTFGQCKPDNVVFNGFLIYIYSSLVYIFFIAGIGFL